MKTILHFILVIISCVCLHFLLVFTSCFYFHFILFQTSCKLIWKNGIFQLHVVKGELCWRLLQCFRLTNQRKWTNLCSNGALPFHPLPPPPPLWSRTVKNPDVGTSLVRSLILLHCSLICLIHTARFARALRCAHSLSPSLAGKWIIRWLFCWVFFCSGP